MVKTKKQKQKQKQKQKNKKIFLFFFTFLFFHLTQSNKAFAHTRLNPIDYGEQLTYYNKDFCNNHQTS